MEKLANLEMERVKYSVEKQNIVKSCEFLYIIFINT